MIPPAPCGVSLDETAFQRFASTRVFKPPDVGPMLDKLPIASEATPGERPRQLEPDETSRRFTTSPPRMFPIAKFNLPRAVHHLRSDEGKRRLGELHEAIAGRICRKQKFARKFGTGFGGFPDCLALLNPPAGSGQIGGWQ